MDIIKTRASETSTNLRTTANTPECSRLVSEIATQRADAIDRAYSFLEDSNHRVAFIGQIGVGKSSMIAVLTQLLIGDTPNSREMMKQNCVLAVGSGGTTVCEVRIRPQLESDSDKVGLIIVPYTVEEIREEICFFAHDEWNRRQPNSTRDKDDSEDPMPREIQKAIRQMTGLPQESKTVTENGQKRRLMVDPLDDVIVHHDSESSFANYLVERAGLLGRTHTEWWWDETPDTYDALKQRFAGVNHGKIPTAMLPKLITIVVPDTIPGMNHEYSVEVIDTRGFDGHLAGRVDIQEQIRDPKTLIVVCVPFRDAPGLTVKTLLEDISNNAELRSATARTSLVLLDHGDAVGVNGSNGDREFGQQIKEDECRRSLEMSGLTEFVKPGTSTVCDTLNDGREGLLRFIETQIRSMRNAVEADLTRQVEDAQQFLGSLDDQALTLAREEIDQRLKTTLKANLPDRAPLSDPLEGIYDGIRDWRFASQVYACCRANGRFRNMDAYSIIRDGARKAITELLEAVNAVIQGVTKSMEQDPEFADVQGHLRLRHTQFESAYIDCISQYAQSVVDEVESALSDDDVWTRCQSEWGKGNGFKTRVIEHLTQWSESQKQLIAYQETGSALFLTVASPIGE